MASWFELRPATLNDLPVLVRHRRRMFVEMDGLKAITYSADQLDRMEAAYTHFAREHLIDGRMQAWVIEDAGRIAASGAVLYTDWLPRPDGQPAVLAYIHSVYTEPDCRRIGLARRLLRAMIDDARARGLPRLSLHASDQGRGLYAQLGFAATNEMRLVLS